MFASTFREELAKRQGHNVIIYTFNYGQPGILAIVEANYVTVVETPGYGLYETQNIPIEAIQAAFFPA